MINGKIYIGIHKQKAEGFDGYLGSGFLLNRSISYYGKENFKRETIQSFEDWETARLAEKEIVNEDFVLRDDTYNVAIGGQGGNTIFGLSEEEKKAIYEKRHLTNIEKGNYSYSGEKLDRARRRMLSARIQPNNKGRKHEGEALLNMINVRRVGERKWYTNGSSAKLCFIGQQPEGWVEGRGSNFRGCVSHKEETKKKIAASVSEYVCYNNGKDNLKLKKGTPVPEGYKPGMIQMHNKMWITNGEESKCVKKEQTIPEGWRRGRTFIRKP